MTAATGGFGYGVSSGGGGVARKVASSGGVEVARAIGEGSRRPGLGVSAIMRY